MYKITVKGEYMARATISGLLVESCAGLTSKFVSVYNRTEFIFRYRGDARIVLRKIAAALNLKTASVKDEIEFMNAKAVIEKIE